MLYTYKYAYHILLGWSYTTPGEIFSLCLHGRPVFSAIYMWWSGSTARGKASDSQWALSELCTRCSQLHGPAVLCEPSVSSILKPDGLSEEARTQLLGVKTSNKCQGTSPATVLIPPFGFQPPTVPGYYVNNQSLGEPRLKWAFSASQSPIKLNI